MVAGLGFNIACQQDASFFEQMRRKYFVELTDDKIVNFDDEARNMVVNKFRLATQDFYSDNTTTQSNNFIH